MDEIIDEKRQIAVNLGHNEDGESTLYTRVHSDPVSSNKENHDVHNTAVRSLEITDSGWHTDRIYPQDYAVDDVKNEDAWLLIRRFNKRVFHIKHTPNHPKDKMDLEVAEDEQFSPNKLRAQLERLYMGAILGFIISRQHISRLQSWREPRRTAAFCITYFTVWYLNFLMPTLLATLLAALLSSKIRTTLFPPCPPSLVHYQGGHLIKPPAGMLGTTDTATGAPENLKGETLEREASNFATGLVALSVNIFVDKDPQHDESQRGGGRTENLKDPRSMATRITTAKDKAAGVENPSWDKTRSPMQELMWSQMRPLMHWICRFCDIWERSANLIDPSAPFPRHVARRRIIRTILPILILAIFMSPYMFYRITTLCFGIAFFGSISLRTSYKGFRSLIHKIVFQRIPTDSQITIALLRQGERNKTPLSPPPVPKGPPSGKPHSIDDTVIGAAGNDSPLSVSQHEILAAAEQDVGTTKNTGGDDHESCKSGSGGKKRSKLLSVIRPVAQAAAKTLIGVDKVRAKTGSESAKNRLGAASPREEPPIAGPVEFTCRWRGERGFVYLTTDTVGPALCYSKKSSVGDLDSSEYQEVQPEWAIPVADIVTLNKYSGYGTKAKLLAGWALEDDIVDGVEIVDSKGKAVLVTAMVRRDELFNRLCAIGNQKWEIW
ncbi:unnamed protein product [Fusarium graminearum]|uniref:Uncharacterized protein n=1 Tax=Gibberella zeae TaxID=5518 RepID=A0A2H3GVU7_GIBZA|nr:hypothetical protein FG05_05756 [Fusarium graminearum]PCD31838.1 hypothetical protein FGRA07_09837 [Fusarium graminearum]CAF3461888.1 unnamed protein product [Fusarium graminearum]CAF3490938.1 unnamed protein product [Fusarium graminearum]CAG1960545.1 unnamed protein product [Fusarium graminearum]